MFHRVVRFAQQIGWIAVIAITSIATIAQSTGPTESCVALVTAALQAADAACTGTARNQVCYGNILNDATPVDGVTDFVFETTGDIEDLIRLQSLELSPLNEARAEWGVAIMQLQASLPASLPGQNVTFVLFGNTRIESNTGPQARIPATSRVPANIRVGPASSATVVGSVERGGDVTATGKTINAAGELWLRVFFENYRTRTGWMLGDLVDVDIDSLPDVGWRSQAYNPMQAFYFSTGIGRPNCAAVPEGGLLVQTPRGVGKVNFNFNGIEVGLGSTAYFTAASPDERTCMSLLEGGADVSSGGSGDSIVPGERACVSAPNQPPIIEPFDADEVASLLPLLSVLPVSIEVPPPAPRRTPRPTAQPPAAPEPEPATQVSAPSAATPGVTPRFVTGSYSRQYFTANFTASFGPDTPSIVRWDFGDSVGTASGASASYTYAGGGTYTARVEACWSDGFCTRSNLAVNIPACAIDFSVSGSIQFNFVGSTESFQVGKKDEQCNPIDLEVLNSTQTSYGGGTFRGEHWYAVDLGSSVTVVDIVVPDGNPLVYNVP